MKMKVLFRNKKNQQSKMYVQKINMDVEAI